MDKDQHRPFPKRDRLKQLRAFCRTARLGGISRAAEWLASSQPAVSLQVRTLEEELGVTLFERRGPNITLTRIGENLYRLAMPLVEGMDRLPGTFAERHHGVVSDHLRIGAGETSAAYLLPEYLKRFRERYPGIRVEVKTGSGQQRLDWLRHYELDITIAALDAPSPDVVCHLVSTSDFLLVTPLDHPLAGRETVTLAETAPYPFVGHGSRHYIRRIAEMAMRLSSPGSNPDVVVEVDGWDAIMCYVAAGVGISVVPELCLTKQRHQVWTASFEGALPLPRRYGAIMRRDGLIAMAAYNFLRIMVPDRLGAPWELGRS